MSSSRRNIFINATATRHGGGLTILLQFLSACTAYSLSNTDIYVFTTIDLETDFPAFIIPVKMKPLSYLQRIAWDMQGMKKWAKQRNLKPDLIISFQNTGVRYKGVQQMIYLQQSIPFTNHQWNPFKNSERMLWLYKNIYPFFIGLNLYPDTQIVVQAAWMKQAFLKKFKRHNNQNVHVFSPEINSINQQNIANVLPVAVQNNALNLFYPAAYFKYKNHLQIIKAFAALKQEIKHVNAICYLTIKWTDLSSEAIQLLNNHALSSNFVFLGQLTLSEVYGYYAAVDVMLFPSYIETIGLPLIEAASFGLPIIAANEPYAQEVLKSYNNAIFVPSKSISGWKKELLNAPKLTKTQPQQLKISDKSWSDLIYLIEQRLK